MKYAPITLVDVELHVVTYVHIMLNVKYSVRK